ncbi:MAG: DMT family transporter [Planctomycetota bacterium]
MDVRECLSLRALLVVVFWGLAFVATRVALTVLTPAGLVATRLMIGCVTMLAVARLMGRSVLPRPADRPRCVLLGLILTAHLLIQAHGLVRTTATNTGWIIAFTPIAIAIGAWLFLRDRLPGRTWIGIALGTAGVLLISLSSGTGFTDAKVGDLLQLVSCITWAAYTLLAVGPVARNGSLPVSRGGGCGRCGVGRAAWAVGGWSGHCGGGCSRRVPGIGLFGDCVLAVVRRGSRPGLHDGRRVSVPRTIRHLVRGDDDPGRAARRHRTDRRRDGPGGRLGGLVGPSTRRVSGRATGGMVMSMRVVSVNVGRPVSSAIGR